MGLSPASSFLCFAPDCPRACHFRITLEKLGIGHQLLSFSGQLCQWLSDDGTRSYCICLWGTESRGAQHPQEGEDGGWGRTSLSSAKVMTYTGWGA